MGRWAGDHYFSRTTDGDGVGTVLRASQRDDAGSVDRAYALDPRVRPMTLSTTTGWVQGFPEGMVVSFVELGTQVMVAGEKVEFLLDPYESSE